MGTYKNKGFPLRINEDILKKIKTIAEKEKRSANMQIEKILTEYIDNYEKQNGTIKQIKIGRDNNGNITM